MSYEQLLKDLETASENHKEGLRALVKAHRNFEKFHVVNKKRERPSSPSPPETESTVNCEGRFWEDDKPGCPGGKNSDQKAKARILGKHEVCKACRSAWDKRNNKLKKAKKQEQQAAE